MIFHKQLFRHDPESGVYGDCARTVIACILRMDIEDVPHVHGDITGEDQSAMHDEFLAKHGINRIWIAFRAETPDQAVDWASQWSNGMPFILSGESPRGTNHVVIGHEGKIIHDPHPDGGDLVGPTDNDHYYVEWLVRRP